MSSFICEQCGAEILDTDHGYITGCEHYPLRKFIPIAPALKRKREKKRKEHLAALRSMNK